MTMMRSLMPDLVEMMPVLMRAALIMITLLYPGDAGVDAGGVVEAPWGP